MTEWKEYKLGEIVQSISDTYKFVDNEKVVFLNTSDILNGKFLNDCLVSAATLPGQAKKKIQKGDILFSEIRPANKRFAIVDFESSNYVVSTKLMVLRCNEQIYNKFLYIYLTSYEVLEYLQMIAEDRSGTFPQITFDNIANMSISLPPLPEQIRIASILSSLDDKIDLLHRENKTLEAMAETLFRQWFIEEAKEDWEEVSLEYVCERITDGSHYSPESVESGLPMASVKDMEDWGINLNSCRKISKEEFDKLVSADCLPQVNDILIAKDGSYLKHIFVVNKMQEVVILSSIAIIRPNGLYHPYLLSLLLKLDSIKEELKNIVTGAVIPRIVLKDFRKFPIILPPKEKQEKALLFIEPIMKKCFYNREQIQTLIQQRDSLLPKLMSGEVKI